MMILFLLLLPLPLRTLRLWPSQMLFLLLLLRLHSSKAPNGMLGEVLEIPITTTKAQPLGRKLSETELPDCKSLARIGPK